VRFPALRFVSVGLLMLAVCLLSGCFSTLQTAKVTDGFSFTGGVYSYTVEKHSYHKSHYEDHYLLILMPRHGWPATEKRWGFEGGVRLISDWVDPDDPEDPIWIFLEEFKLQIPRNKHLDLAFGVDFWLILPGSIYVLASKDLNKTFTIYGSAELFGGLYSITLEENETGLYPKVTSGCEINFHKNFSGLIEMENWFNPDWNWRENIRFAAGIKVVP
jgi:hypothetical protein